MYQIFLILCSSACVCKSHAMSVVFFYSSVIVFTCLLLACIFSKDTANTVPRLGNGTSMLSIFAVISISLMSVSLPLGL